MFFFDLDSGNHIGVTVTRRSSWQLWPNSTEFEPCSAYVMDIL